MSGIKGAGLNPLSYWHHNDHLAPICLSLGIPLLLSDPEWVKLCQRYYPDVDIRYIAWENFTLSGLVQDYDVFFRSDLWKRDSFKAAIAPYEKQFQKCIRTVHCPHGFSDKAFWLEKCVDEDATLIYGPHMVDQLKARGAWDRIGTAIITGNYRLSYYEKYKSRLDAIVEEEVFSAFAKKQTCILYAPSWKDEEDSSSFFSAIDQIMDQLPDELNLLIKLHPMLEQNDIAELFRIQGSYEHRPNVLFLDRFPLVYPILNRVDAYLGDASAVGYDFLAMNRPLFFLASDVQQLYLHRCGEVIRPNRWLQAFAVIQAFLSKADDPFRETRQQVYHYTFGDPCDLDRLAEQIGSACS